MTDGFQFNLKAKRTRLSDGDLIAALQSAAKALGEGYFASTQYDGLPGERGFSRWEDIKGAATRRKY